MGIEFSLTISFLAFLVAVIALTAIVYGRDEITKQALKVLNKTISTLSAGNEQQSNNIEE